MTAHAGDFAVVHNDDLVGILNRRNALCDYDFGRVGKLGCKGLSDFCLGGCIDGAVESSRMSIFGCLSSALAMQSRCFCPPETFVPPWSSMVSYPSGSFLRTYRPAPFLRRRRSVRHQPRRLPNGDCRKWSPRKHVFLKHHADSLAEMIKAVIFNVGSVHKHLALIAVVKTGMSETSVVFPQPVEPIIPTVSPGSTVRFMSESTASSLVL